MTLCRFLVRGSHSPELPMRILNLIAQQDLAFERASVETSGEFYLIRVDQRRLSLERGSVILEKIRAMVLVEEADLVWIGCG